jgi:predicted secreted protein
LIKDTPWLPLQRGAYVPSDTNGKMVRFGGTRIWDITTVATGGQKIQAVYQRPWEQAAGNETTFSKTVAVT